MLYPGGTGPIYHLPADFYHVGTDANGEYIIGVIFNGRLYPLIALIGNLGNTFGRVKVFINGNNANVIVPILENDPLNSLFRMRFGPRNIRSAQISGIGGRLAHIFTNLL